MDEIIKIVCQRTGLSEAQARPAVEATINLLKEKLPAPIASQIDVALGNVKADMVDSVMKGLEGLLGKK